MKRGNIITAAMRGDYGKPRPALVIQSDLFNHHPTITIIPITSELREAPLFRYTLSQNKTTGLEKVSQLMIDKMTTIKVDKAGETIGHLSGHQMTEITRLVALWLGIG